MRLTEKQYYALFHRIENTRSRIEKEMFKRYPYALYEDGLEMAENHVVRQCYLRLDRSIMEEEMEAYRPKT